METTANVPMTRRRVELLSGVLIVLCPTLRREFPAGDDTVAELVADGLVVLEGPPHYQFVELTQRGRNMVFDNPGLIPEEIREYFVETSQGGGES
jgi:hypothetical protein